jgi:hypothetical protein
MKLANLFARLTLLFSVCLASAAAGAQERTLITSDELEMQGSGERNFFYFNGNVRVRGTNLSIDCDELTVVALREGTEEAAIGRIGAIERIVARGSVVIEQAGRKAFAGLAEVDPVAGSVTLSEQPRIIDNDVEVEGYQFVLLKGQRKFISVPDPNAPADQPSRSVVRLGSLPDLGFDQDEAQIEQSLPLTSSGSEATDSADTEATDSADTEAEDE